MLCSLAAKIADAGCLQLYTSCWYAKLFKRYGQCCRHMCVHAGIIKLYLLALSCWHSSQRFITVHACGCYDIQPYVLQVLAWVQAQMLVWLQLAGVRLQSS